MASDKDKMLSNANYYADIVAAAAKACTEAASSLSTSQGQVSDNWQGASGVAMVQALSDIQTEIKQIASQLNSLESQMRSHARSIYNNWPEEEKAIE